MCHVSWSHVSIKLKWCLHIAAIHAASDYIKRKDKVLRGKIFYINTGHLTGCGGVDLHNSLTSASFASSEHFPQKNRKNSA